LRWLADKGKFLSFLLHKCLCHTNLLNNLEIIIHSVNLQFVVGFEALTVEVMNVAILWDIVPCSSYMNMGICSFEMSVHIQNTRRYILEDGYNLLFSSYNF
jgi:hypothetical protein